LRCTTIFEIEVVTMYKLFFRFNIYSTFLMPENNNIMNGILLSTNEGEPTIYLFFLYIGDDSNRSLVYRQKLMFCLIKINSRSFCNRIGKILTVDGENFIRHLCPFKLFCKMNAIWCGLNTSKIYGQKEWDYSSLIEYNFSCL
jgi:hypothetical protein